MMIHPSAFASLACACALLGCAAPYKAVVIVPVPKPSSVKSPTATTEAVAKPSAEDGLRTGNLLALPTDTEYRATNPALPKTGAGTGTVIVSPPSPPKSKPPAAPGE